MLNRKLVNRIGFAGVMAFGSAAFAAIAKHPGTSVKGATTAQNQVNLTADPSGGTMTTTGTITSTYDPSLLSVSTVTSEPGYLISSVVVQTTNGYDTFGFGDASSVTIGALDGPQVGAVQVNFATDPNSADGSPIVVQDGTDDSGNPIYGDLTHIITFDLTSQGIADANAATPNDPVLVDLANVPSLGTGNAGTGDNSVGDFPSQDQFTEVDSTDPTNPVYTTYYANGDPGTGDNAIGPAYTSVSITGPLDQVTPEPSCIALLGVSGTLLLRRNRRVI